MDTKRRTQTSLFDAEPDDIFAQLKERFTASRNDIARLQSRVSFLENENVELQREAAVIPGLQDTNSELRHENEELKAQLAEREAALKETEAFLCTVKTNEKSRNEYVAPWTSFTLTQSPSVSKRPRSPSLEIPEVEQPSLKRFKSDATTAALASLEEKMRRIDEYEKQAEAERQRQRDTMEQIASFNQLLFEAIRLNDPGQALPTASKNNLVKLLVEYEEDAELSGNEKCEDIVMNVEGSPAAPVTAGEISSSKHTSLAAVPSASSHLDSANPAQTGPILASTVQDIAPPVSQFASSNGVVALPAKASSGSPYKALAFRQMVTPTVGSLKSTMPRLAFPIPNSIGKEKENQVTVTRLRDSHGEKDKEAVTTAAEKEKKKENTNHVVPASSPGAMIQANKMIAPPQPPLPQALGATAAGPIPSGHGVKPSASTSAMEGDGQAASRASTNSNNAPVPQVQAATSTVASTSTAIPPTGAQVCPPSSSSSAMQVDKVSAGIPAAAPAPAASLRAASVFPIGSFVSGTLQIKASGAFSQPMPSSSASEPVKIESSDGMLGRSHKPLPTRLKVTTASNDRPLHSAAGSSQAAVAPSVGPKSPVQQAILNSIAQSQTVRSNAISISAASAPAPAADLQSQKTVSAHPPAAVTGARALPAGHSQQQAQSHHNPEGSTSLIKQEPTRSSLSETLTPAQATATPVPAAPVPKVSAAATGSAAVPPPGANLNMASQNMGSVVTTSSAPAILNSASSAGGSQLQGQGQVQSQLRSGAQSSGQTIQAQQNRTSASSSRSQTQAQAVAVPASSTAPPKVSASATSTSASAPVPRVNATSRTQVVGVAPALVRPPSSSVSSLPGPSSAQPQPHRASEAQAQVQRNTTMSVSTQLPPAQVKSAYSQKEQTAASSPAIPHTPASSSSATVTANANVNSSQNSAAMLVAAMISALMQPQTTTNGQVSSLPGSSTGGGQMSEATASAPPTMIALNPSGSIVAQNLIGRSQSTRPSTSPFKRNVSASTSSISTLRSASPSLLEDMKKSCLGSAAPLPISPQPHDLQIPRTFLRLAYGGSDQQWVQFIAADRNPSGPSLRRLVFPKLDLNPAMPTSPGEPGLIFSSRHEILSDPPWSVFHKVSPTSKKKNPVVWKYLGDYECVLCGRVNAEQFQALTDEVKRQWAQALLDTKRFEVYVAMRARIALRLAGLIPVGNGTDVSPYEEAIKDEIKAIQRGNGHSVREEDIIAAFSRGDEAIDIIRLTCVKYDHVFADHMKGKYATYPAMLAEHDQKKANGEIKTRNRTKGKKNAHQVTSRPPARKQTSASPMSDDEGEEDHGNEFLYPSGPHDDFVMPGLHPSSNDVESRVPSITIPPRPRRSTRSDFPILDIDSDGYDEFDW